MSAAKRMWEESYENGLFRDVDYYWEQRSDFEPMRRERTTKQTLPSYEVGYIQNGIFRQLLICIGAKSARSQVKKIQKHNPNTILFRKLK